MSKDQQEQLFDDLVLRALVPRGFRPESDDEIEAMLEALGDCDDSEERTQRLKAKILSNDGPDLEKELRIEGSVEIDTSEANEFAEMFRGKGEDLPPELEQRLREMEDQASQPTDDEETDPGNLK